MTCRLRSDGTIAKISDGLASCLGGTPDELIGVVFRSLIALPDRRRLDDTLATLGRNHPATTLDCRPARGGETWFTIRLEAAVFHGDGSPGEVMVRLGEAGAGAFAEAPPAPDREGEGSDGKSQAQKIVETLHEPLLVLRPDLTVVIANAAFYRQFRTEHTSTIGRKIYELGNGQWDIPSLRRLLEEVLPTDSTFDDFEVSHDFKDIGTRVMLLNGRRLEQLQFILLGIRDITEIKRTEERLRWAAESQRFRAALGDAIRGPDDPSRIMAQVARLLAEHFGASRVRCAELRNGEFAGEHEAFPPPGDGRGRLMLSDFGRRASAEVVSGRVVAVSDVSEDPLLENDERARLQSAGEIGAFLLVPVLDGDSVTGVLIVEQDAPRAWSEEQIALIGEAGERAHAAAERVRAHAEMRISESRARELANSAPATIWLTDTENRCVFLSRDWHETTGQNAEDALGYGWLNAGHPDDRERVRRAFLDASSRREPFSADYRLRLKDESHRWVVTTGRPRFDQTGGFLGYIGTLVDVDERKQAEEALAEREHQLRIITDSTPALIAYVDADLRYQFVNRQYELWFSKDRSELIGRTMAEVLGEEAAESVRHHAEAALRGEHVQFIARPPYRDREPCWVEAQFVPDTDPDGVVRGFFVHVLDVSERTAADERIRVSNELFQRLADAMPQLVWVSDDTGRVTYFNKQMSRYRGITASGETGSHEWHPMVHSEDRPATVQAWRTAVATGTDYQFEHRLQMADGSYRWHLSRASKSGPPGSAQWFGTATDVHDLKIAQENAARLAAIVASSSDAIISKDLNAVVTTWNKGAELLFGYTAQETIGQRIQILIPEDRIEEENLILSRIRAGERLERFESVRVTKDGRHLDVSLTISPVLDQSGAVVGAAKIVRDVSAQKRAEVALRESEEHFRTLADNIAQFAWMADPEGAIFWFNKRWYEYTGTTFEQMRGWGWKKVHHPDHIDRVVEKITRHWASGQEWNDTFPLRGKDGEYRWFLSRAVPIHDEQGRILRWFGTNTDVTEQLALEEALSRHAEELEQRVAERTKELQETHERLRMSERMAMMGTLSAGLGHDMGNLLLPIRVRLDSLASQPLNEQAKEDIEAIRTSADYLKRLASGLRLLALDPRRESRRETVDLPSWWQEAGGVLRSVLPRTVSLEAELPTGLRAAISRAALAQIIFNLVQNAGDAMRDRPSGLIRLTAESLNEKIRLRVHDNGPGMTEEVRLRCMEPFYTTKTRGISTGLGLALVWGLVQEAGGKIELESAPEKGTTFIITLPSSSPSPKRVDGTGLRAMVALADPRMRSLVSKELKSMGVSVCIAGTGAADEGGAVDMRVADRPEHLKDAAPHHRAILFSDEGVPEIPGVRRLPLRPGLVGLVRALRELIEEVRAAGSGGPSA